MINSLAITLNETEKNDLKVLLIFNKLGDFKHEIYDGFLSQIDGRASVDLYIHSISNHNSRHFEEVIHEKMDTYDYFAIMLHATHLNEDILKTVNSIPKEKLLILDKRNEFIRGWSFSRAPKLVAMFSKTPSSRQRRFRLSKGI